MRRRTVLTALGATTLGGCLSQAEQLANQKTKTMTQQTPQNVIVTWRCLLPIWIKIYNQERNDRKVLIGNRACISQSWSGYLDPFEKYILRVAEDWIS